MAKSIRPAKKAGSWYKSNASVLSQELERNLDGVSADRIGKGTLPIPGARAIIAPHAGYEYSGECAAWAYKCLDLSKAKKVFILGPSHAIYLPSCAVTSFEYYATPFGDLKVDLQTIQKLKDEGLGVLDQLPEMREHSLEMHLPYLYKRLQQTFGDKGFPTIVPIIVGSIKGDQEKKMGKILAPYVKDSSNAFIISSDFCHWGDNFSYVPYSATGSVNEIKHLGDGEGPKRDGPTVESTIELIDRHAIDALETGDHDKFLASFELTGNTVCGRHPIGVMMAALEVVSAEDAKSEKYLFKEVKYITSGQVKDDDPIEDSYGHSVSYVSAFALL